MKNKLHSFFGITLVFALFFFGLWAITGCSSGGGGGSDTYAISGTITGASSVTVTLSGAKSATTTTSSTGAYSFTGLSSGSYTLTPSKSGYTFSPATRSVAVSSANVTGQNFTASSTAGYLISGTITGASSVTVTLSGAKSATTTTSTTGAYSFTSLSNGSYTVTPTKSGYTFSPATRSVAVSGASVTAQNFTASAVTYSISGNVAGATSVTLTLSGAKTAVTTSDADGDYSFGGLSNGSYTVTPSKTSYTFSPSSKAITISGANSTGNNFTGSIVTRKYNISGTINWSGFGHSSGVFVVILSTDPNFDSGSFTSYEVVTISSGAQSGSRNYSFTNVSSGTYYIGGLICQQNPLTTGSPQNGDKLGTYSTGTWGENPATAIYATGSTTNLTGKNFSLLTTYEVSPKIYGFVRNSNNDPISGVTVNMTGSSTGTDYTDSDGRYDFNDLSAGSYTITPTKNGYSFSPTSRSATITSSSGEVQLGQFTGTGTSSGYTVSGTVISTREQGHEGQNIPISGVSVSLAPWNWSSGTPETKVSTTGADGVFSLSGLIAGNYIFIAEKLGYIFDEMPDFSASGGGKSWTVGITNQDISGVIFPTRPQAITYCTLSGEVSYGPEEQKPINPKIEGATISVVYNDSVITSETTGLNGRYSISIPQNYSVMVMVSHPQYAFNVNGRAIWMDANKTQDFFADYYLGTSYEVSGQVTDETGAGVLARANFSGTFYQYGLYGLNQRTYNISNETDSSGNYSVMLYNNSYNNIWTATAGKIGTGSYNKTKYLTVESTSVSNYNLLVRTLYGLSGTVTKETGEGLQSVQIRFEVFDEGVFSNYDMTTTNSDGTYSENVPVGLTMRVTPTYNGAPSWLYTFLPQTREVEISGAVSGQDFLAVSAEAHKVYGTMTGFLSGAETPLIIYGEYYDYSGGTFVDSGTISIDQNTGSYSSTFVHPGHYWFAPREAYNRYSFSPASIEVDLTLNDASGVDFTMNTGGTELLTAIVTDESGAPVEGLTIVATHRHGFFPTVVATTDVTGQTILPLTKEAGEPAHISYDLKFYKETYDISDDIVYSPSTETRYYRAGRYAIIRGRLTGDTPHDYGQIMGIVRASMGEPVTNDWIWQIDGDGNYYFPSSTPETVVKTLRVTPGVTYNLSVIAANFWPGSVYYSPVETKEVVFDSSYISTGNDFEINFCYISGEITGLSAGTEVPYNFYSLTGGYPVGTGTLTVDAEGKFIIKSTGMDPRNGNAYAITPTGNTYNFSPASREGTLVSGHADIGSFAATPKTWEIAGRVTKESGEGVGGVTLTLGGDSSEVISGWGDGYYRFYNLPNGNYTVTPYRSGYTFTPTTQEVTISDNNPYDINFLGVSEGPLYTISGEVSWTGMTFTTPEVGGTLFVGVFATDPLSGGGEPLDTYSVPGITDTTGSHSYTLTGLSSGDAYVVAVLYSGSSGGQPGPSDFLGMGSPYPKTLNTDWSGANITVGPMGP